MALYFLLPVGLNSGAQMLIRQDKIAKSDVIIALGGDARCARERKAAELYKQGRASKLVVSGVNYVWGIHTGDAAKRYVVSLGVPESDVTVIRDAWNTRNEAQVLKQLMSENGWKSAIVVTSPFHSRRALYTIERAVPGKTFYSSPVEAQSPEWMPKDWWKRRGDVFLTSREFFSWANTLVNGCE